MQKGKTNNPNGRPAGKPNKITVSLKEKINTIIENNIDLVQKDLKSIEPKDRLQLLFKLFEYVLPKQKEMKIEEVKGKGLGINDLVPADKMKLAEMLLKYPR